MDSKERKALPELQGGTRAIGRLQSVCFFFFFVCAQARRRFSYSLVSFFCLCSFTCSQCSHEFCWLCRGPWSTHGTHTGGYYNCNLYDPAKHDRETVDEARFGRWGHYLSRFNHHDEAGRVAAESRGEVQEKARVFEQLYPGWSGQFLLDALALVIDVRYILKYSYIAAFGFDDSYKHREFFEFLQGHLEESVSSLYESLSATEVSDILVADFKAHTNATRLYYTHLTDAIEYGLTAGFAEAQLPMKAPPVKTTRRWAWWS
jgi:hypothetical protein